MLTQKNRPVRARADAAPPVAQAAAAADADGVACALFGAVAHGVLPYRNGWSNSQPLRGRTLVALQRLPKKRAAHPHRAVAWGVLQSPCARAYEVLARCL